MSANSRYFNKITLIYKETPCLTKNRVNYIVFIVAMSETQHPPISEPIDEEILSLERSLEPKVQKYLERLLQNPVVIMGLDELRTRISLVKTPELKYHQPEHTDDVLHEAILFALADKELNSKGFSEAQDLTDRELELLAIGCVYHDIGYSGGPKDHEERGAQLAEIMMMSTRESYSMQEIEQVKKAILSTKLQNTDQGLVQQPQNDRLSRYLQDADVSNFGRSDALEKSKLVFEETKGTDWGKFLVFTKERLLKPHKFQSTAGRLMRQKGQEGNIDRANQEIARHQQAA